MSKTSTAVKQRYINKTYESWTLRLRHEDFDKIESVRGEMSRAEFIKYLVSKVYGINFEKESD